MEILGRSSHRPACLRAHRVETFEEKSLSTSVVVVDRDKGFICPRLRLIYFLKALTLETFEDLGAL